ncbi:MAG: hypothetical protein WA672_18630, partial [Candidatus Angelobacter sp.]
MKLSLRSILKSIFVLVTLTSLNCWSQIASVTADVAPPSPGTADNIYGLNETVTPGGGALNINIPLDLPSGRGVTVPFSFTYNSNQAHVLVGPFTAANGMQGDNQYVLGQGGWAYRFPVLQAHEHVVRVLATPNSQEPQYYNCYYYTDYQATDMAGTPHMLNLSVAPQNPQGYCAPFRNVLTGGDYTVQATAGDPGSGFNLNRFTGVTVADRDGTVYSFNANPLHSFGNVTSPSYSELPDRILDRNGNQAIITDNGNGAFSVVDSAGRPAFSTSGFGNATSGDTINVGGGPSPMQFKVNWTTATANTPFQSLVTIDAPYTGSVGCGSASSWNVTVPAIKSIVLPNGKSYQFTYDPVSGLLQQITYPNGATVTYTWGYSNGYANALDFYPPTSWGSHPSVPPNQPGPCHEMYQTQVITKRVVSFDGHTPALEQDFQYFTTWSQQTSTYA